MKDNRILTVLIIQTVIWIIILYLGYQAYLMYDEKISKIPDLSGIFNKKK